MALGKAPRRQSGLLSRSSWSSPWTWPTARSRHQHVEKSKMQCYVIEKDPPDPGSKLRGPGRPIGSGSGRRFQSNMSVNI